MQFPLTGNFTRNDLNVKFKVKDLKSFLERRAINVTHCCERSDLVELVLQHSNSSTHFREEQEHEAHLHTLQVEWWTRGLDVVCLSSNKKLRVHKKSFFRIVDIF